MPLLTTRLLSMSTRHYSGCGTNYAVQTVAGNQYRFMVDGNNDLMMMKSTDGGLNWGSITAINSVTIEALSVWYDRWSGIAAGLIHLAYTESSSSDVFYRSVNTESADALSAETTIFAGATWGAGGCLSLTRTRGGNLLCHLMIDAGAEGGFYRSTDVGATWGARTVNEAIAMQDQIIMMPGWAADNQDGMAFFWDSSANEISRYLYDDSADTWAETSIAASMTDLIGSSPGQPGFAAAVDITNSQNLLVAWSNVDTLNADLRCWKVTESAITEVTNLVLNSTDDQGMCGISIDTQTGYWHALYCGKSDGSETFTAALKTYKKISQDSGTTWGAETVISALNACSIVSLQCVPRCVGASPVFHQVSAWSAAADSGHYVSLNVLFPRAQSLLGV